DGGSILICGRTLEDRLQLMQTAAQQAQMTGMRVLQVVNSRDLGQRLNLMGDTQAIFERLAEDAEDTPVLLMVADIPPGDPMLEQLLHMGVRSGEPILMLAGTQYVPADPGRITVLPLQ
ncbi:MAG TPA: hypothetical protein VGO93_15650, partial [Candidatus Xenobia bacterium]